MEHEDFEIQPIGRIDNGIDGSDAFYQVTDKNYSPINADVVLDIFRTEFYRETYQEAGGYFCKHFEVYTNPIHDYRAVVKVEHRYDV
jgi:hypothetical protein